jgi:LPS export ABC transporter protein LptC
MLVRNTAVMVVLAVLAAATWLATWQGQGSSPGLEGAAEAGPFGYYARGARLYRTDDEGRFVTHVFAERLDELPGEEQLQLTGVSVEYRPADDTAWTLSAATAKYSRDGSRVDLAGEVAVRSSPADGSRPVTILTDKLLFSPDTSTAESSEAVEIHVGDWQLQGVGLRALLKEDSLKLESEVHGTFVP